MDALPPDTRVDSRNVLEEHVMQKSDERRPEEVDDVRGTGKVVRDRPEKVGMCAVLEERSGYERVLQGSTEVTMVRHRLIIPTSGTNAGCSIVASSKHLHASSPYILSEKPCVWHAPSTSSSLVSLKYASLHWRAHYLTCPHRTHRACTSARAL